MATNKASSSEKSSVNDTELPENSTLAHVTSEAEKAYIERILKSTNGNKTKAAEILGISRKSLWEKIKAYKIESSI
jgi:transcriptional regulator with PAS, ATPase and Fis domain